MPIAALTDFADIVFCINRGCIAERVLPVFRPDEELDSVDLAGGGQQVLAVVLHVIEQRLRLFRIAVLRKTKQLAGTVEVNLLVAQLGDQLCDVLGHRSEQRGQSRGAAHNVESLGGDARERQSGQRLVEHIGEQFGLILETSATVRTILFLTVPESVTTTITKFILSTAMISNCRMAICVMAGVIATDA